MQDFYYDSFYYNIYKYFSRWCCIYKLHKQSWSELHHFQLKSTKKKCKNCFLFGAFQDGCTTKPQRGSVYQSVRGRNRSLPSQDSSKRCRSGAPRCCSWLESAAGKVQPGKCRRCVKNEATTRALFTTRGVRLKIGPGLRFGQWSQIAERNPPVLVGAGLPGQDGRRSSIRGPAADQQLHRGWLTDRDAVAGVNA